MQFADLRLVEPILRALSSEGYSTATPIQAKAIPPALEGRDVLGCAQTGTGKTAAFALPTLQRLSAKQQSGGRTRVRCLVLCPTRELATQIGDGFRAYGKNLHLKHTVIFGGVGQGPQADTLRRGVDILVATPGRLLDLMNQGLADLGAVEVLVLDEADRMLDMGFIRDIRKVVAALPTRRQTMLFSATMPAEIRQLAEAMLRNPAVVQVAPVSSTVETIDQSVYFVEKRHKPQLLAHLVNELPMSRAIVFTRTKHGADKVVRHLHARGIKAEAIHGNKSQNNRQRALTNFKTGKIPVLIATDIASRGIDIDDVSHVVNYDLTHEPETYVHRIGRTARAGASGVAIAFCDQEERENLAVIEKLIRRKIPVRDDHPTYEAAPAHAPAQSHATNGQGRGGRGVMGGRDGRGAHVASGHRDGNGGHEASNGHAGRGGHAQQSRPRHPHPQPRANHPQPRTSSHPQHGGGHAGKPHQRAGGGGARPQQSSPRHETQRSASAHPAGSRPHFQGKVKSNRRNGGGGFSRGSAGRRRAF